MPLRSLESIADEEGIKYLRLKGYFKKCHVPMTGTGSNVKVDPELAHQALLRLDARRDIGKQQKELKKQQDEKRYMQQLNERLYF